MVIDAAKGIEARTRKLFEVCRLRDIPIVTFINKMDRESRDPFELLDEIEKTLALDTAPMTWPIGRGRDFAGTYDIASGEMRLLSRGRQDRRAPQPLDLAALAGQESDARRQGAIAEELALVKEACRPLRLRRLPRGPSDAGVLRLGPEEFRRQGPARRARPASRRRRARKSPTRARSTRTSRR